MNVTESIGWTASFILLLTIASQVYKQWHDHTSKGISLWLFIGQLVSGAAFVVYSWQVKNWVFVVTNCLLFVTNVLGLGITYRHKNRSSKI